MSEDRANAVEADADCGGGDGDDEIKALRRTVGMVAEEKCDRIAGQETKRKTLRRTTGNWDGE